MQGDLEKGGKEEEEDRRKKKWKKRRRRGGGGMVYAHVQKCFQGILCMQFYVDIHTPQNVQGQLFKRLD